MPWRDSNGQRVQYPTAYDGIAEGEKCDKRNASYRKRVDEMLKGQISRDRQELRLRRRAQARFSAVAPLVADAREHEELLSEKLGELVSEKHVPNVRAFRAWSRQMMQDVKADEREDAVSASDVAMSAISSVGRPGVLAPSVVAPPRDMPMPLSIDAAVSHPAYGPAVEASHR